MLYKKDANKYTCLLYTSDAADERSSVDLGGRRIIKKKKNVRNECNRVSIEKTTEMKKAVVHDDRRHTATDYRHIITDRIYE